MFFWWFPGTLCSRTSEDCLAILGCVSMLDCWPRYQTLFIMFYLAADYAEKMSDSYLDTKGTKENDTLWRHKAVCNIIYNLFPIFFNSCHLSGWSNPSGTSTSGVLSCSCNKHQLNTENLLGILFSTGGYGNRWNSLDLVLWVFSFYKK